MKKSAAASVPEEKQCESTEASATCSSTSQPEHLGGFTSASQVYSVSKLQFVFTDRCKCMFKSVFILGLLMDLKKY